MLPKKDKKGTPTTFSVLNISTKHVPPNFWYDDYQDGYGTAKLNSEFPPYDEGFIICPWAPEDADEEEYFKERNLEWLQKIFIRAAEQDCWYVFFSANGAEFDEFEKFNQR